MDWNLVTAVCALVVSVAATVLAVWSALEQRRHMRLSVQPIAAIPVADFENRIGVFFANKGLGPLREEILSCVPEGAARFEKTSFSVLGAEGLEEHLAELGRDQVVVAGIETHVCVGQTVHELLAHGFQPHAVRDAIGARFPLEDETGYAKMIGSGAVPASVEGVLFEWIRDARSPDFKAIHRLVV